MTFLLAAVVLSDTPVVRWQERYEKIEYRIPMRDGVQLHTVAYVPKAEGQHPILLERTPYSAAPYGKEFAPYLPGSDRFVTNNYIFVFQDVRGRHRSEGEFDEIRPLLDGPQGLQTDESTDAYDTVEFLVKQLPRNNGRVGVWGISYPGFYAAASAVRSHPAIKAVSPQAPVSEWWFGDDVHHNGAFFLQDNFDFYFFFGYGQPNAEGEHPQIPGYGPRPDAYEFFLKLGSAEAAYEKYFKGRLPFWEEIMNNGSYNAFWRARSLPPKMRDIRPAMLNVGGWFDAENLHGALRTYRFINQLNSNTSNWLVMGPWYHGAWADGSSTDFGPFQFQQDTATYFREQIEFPFFNHHLRGTSKPDRPKAEAFETGGNRWHRFAEWPPKERLPLDFFLGDGQRLRRQPDQGAEADSYRSDPQNPVPFQPRPADRRSGLYMVADQRFLKDRRDVLRYRTEPLAEPLTVAGPVDVDLRIRTTGTDADFIVKVIDERPDGSEILVRWEVMRARFRKDHSRPEPLTPGRVERIPFSLNDLFHTFKAGHRLHVQVQSSWFPLIDRNPHRFVNIYRAKPKDYQPATIEILHQGLNQSRIRFGVLKDR